MKTEGIIRKGIGGFYYVEAADNIYECRARGIFRKRGETPLPGDHVQITVDIPGSENTIDAIDVRKNTLKRPPVANLDKLFLVVSLCEPQPNLLLTDRLSVYAEYRGIEPVILVTEQDRAPQGAGEEIAEIYRRAGFQAFGVSGVTGENVDRLRAALEGSVSAFAGNSGVGKSTLLNAVDPAWQLQTGVISEKLGRGKHTTRHVELLKVSGGYVADTPGFASFETDLAKTDFISAEELPACFREFRPYLGDCKFSSCAHLRDRGCAVTAAVERGEIPASRYESYAALYEEVKDIRAWQLK